MVRYCCRRQRQPTGSFTASARSRARAGTATSPAALLPSWPRATSSPAPAPAHRTTNAHLTQLHCFICRAHAAGADTLPCRTREPLAPHDVSSSATVRASSPRASTLPLARTMLRIASGSAHARLLSRSRALPPSPMDLRVTGFATQD